MKYIVFFLISLIASLIGGICGIGGGIIIKPVLDVIGFASVSTASFLSSCTVFTMSGYSVVKSLRTKSTEINLKIATFLAAGSVIGGISGNFAFNIIKDNFNNPQEIAAVQAVSLGILTIGTIVYTANKKKIKTLHVKNLFLCLIIGFMLGVSSSFLGIGGGPINLVVLYFFFSMDNKKAKQNSLYIIFFSQMANIITAIVTNNVPDFNFIVLLAMILGGFLGGVFAHEFSHKISEATTEKLFFALMFFILGICVFNYIRYI